MRAFGTPRDRRVILTYHSVGSGPWSVPESRFREQLAWLVENARVTGIDRLLEPDQPCGLEVALTFDDGYECLHGIVAPILQSNGLAATVYLNTACIGDNRRIASDQSKGHYPDEEFLLWNEVLHLRELGWTIGSHGADHVDLTSLQETEVHSQLALSKAAIEGRTDSDCIHFSYTWGKNNRRVRKAVANCSYRWAVTCIHGAVVHPCAPLALRRVDVRQDYELSDFIAAVRGEWDYLGAIQSGRRLLRYRVWRCTELSRIASKSFAQKVHATILYLSDLLFGRFQ